MFAVLGPLSLKHHDGEPRPIQNWASSRRWFRFTMKTQGLEVVDRQVHADGFAIEIHHATLNSRTSWFVVAYPRTSL